MPSNAVPVRNRLCPSTDPRDNEDKDTTTRVGPGPKVLATPVQGLADRKGHDRLMHIMTPHAAVCQDNPQPVDHA